MVYTYTSYCIHDIKLPSQHQTYLYYIKCNALTTESDVIFAIFTKKPVFLGCHDSGRKKGRFLCDFKMMYNVRFFGYYNLILSPIFDYIL